MKETIKKRKKWLATGVFVLAAVLLVVFAIGRGLDKSSPSEITAPEDTSPEPEQGIEAWGEVSYGTVYDISIDFPSVVTDVNVREGDRVTLGQTLLTLDMTEYLGTLEKLRLKLEADKAQLGAVSQDTSALEADIAQTKKDIRTKTGELATGTNANLKMLQTALDLSQKQFESAKEDVSNYQALYESGAVPKETLDQYADILDQRQKAVSDAQESLSKARGDLQTALDQLNLSLKSKEVQLSQLKDANSANTAQQNTGVSASRIDLDIMRNKSVKDYISGNLIVSNVKNGIVQDIRVVNGTRLGMQNAPTTVLSLIDADSIVVSAEVDEEFIKNVVAGETVRIVPESDRDLTLPGTVTRISNVAVEKDGKRIVKVEVKPQDPDGVLKPGYSADVFFPVKK